MEMTSHERLTVALHWQEVDRLPFSPLMDGYFTGSLSKQGFKDDLTETAKYIGRDLMERYVACPKAVYKNVTARRVGNMIIMILLWAPCTSNTKSTYNLLCHKTSVGRL